MLKSTLLIVLTVSVILQITNQQSSTKEFQKTSSGEVCYKGKHLDDDKCVSNNDWCNNYDDFSGNCSECSKWAWQQNNDKQGNYCATHWWAWVLIILGSILLACLIAAAIWYCCCVKHGKKKASGYDEHTEMHQVYDYDKSHERNYYSSSDNYGRGGYGGNLLES